MRLLDIARPCKSSTACSPYLDGRLELDELSPDCLDGQEYMVGISDFNGNLMGEVERERLLYLMMCSRQNSFEKILDWIDEGVIAVDADGKIFYMNRAYPRIIGVPIYKIIGKYIQEIEGDSLLNTGLREKRPLQNKKQLIASVQKYVSVKIYPLYHFKSFAGAVSVFTDVTELDSMYHETQRMSRIVGEVKTMLDTHEAKQNLGIITQDPAMLRLMEQTITSANTDAPVLIRGENGVGKELFAKLLHSSSNRRNMPLITVNCAAIPESLIESELFGYEEGSFTGAGKGGRMGKFEMADKGTIFLDEIGDMSLVMQSKLLRVLQNGEIEKLGRQRNIPVDVRIIAATNQPLEKMMKEKSFREDLFFRLNVIALDIPPLNKRINDIPLLANHFLEVYNKRYRRNLELTPEDYAHLMAFNWSGNVRELQNCIERAVILGRSAIPRGLGNPGAHSPVHPGTVPAQESLMSGQTLQKVLADYEKQLIEQVLREEKGNRTKAMARLGLSRRTFYRRCGQLGVCDKK